MATAFPTRMITVAARALRAKTAQSRSSERGYTRRNSARIPEVAPDDPYPIHPGNDQAFAFEGGAELCVRPLSGLERWSRVTWRWRATVRESWATRAWLFGGQFPQPFQQGCLAPVVAAPILHVKHSLLSGRGSIFARRQ
jgi:hypothetical protein